jgi:menaquinol-cytochrome c reductase iron-sulfur subunit
MNSTRQKTRGEKVSRRQFFEWGIYVIAGFFSILLGVPLVGYFLSVIFRPGVEQWVPVTTLDRIDVLTPTEYAVAFERRDVLRSYEEMRGVFVIRKGNDILAFTNVCTHMHCSVRWLDYRQQIVCPCHGGVYDRWGQLAGGPPPNSLPLYATKVEGNVLYVANRQIFRV